MPANLASKNSAEKEKEKAFYNQIRKEREIRASSHSRPVSLPHNYPIQEESYRPENEEVPERRDNQLEETPSSPDREGPVSQPVQSAQNLPEEDEEKENFFKRSLDLVKHASRQMAKEKGKQLMKAATKKAAAWFSRAVVGAIIGFISGHFLIFLIIIVGALVILFSRYMIILYGEEILETGKILLPFIIQSILP